MLVPSYQERDVTVYFAEVSGDTADLSVIVASTDGAVTVTETVLICVGAAGKVNSRVKSFLSADTVRFAVTAVLFTFTLLLAMSDLKSALPVLVSLILAVYAFPAVKVAVESSLVWPSYHSRVVTEYFAVDGSLVTPDTVVDAVTPAIGAVIFRLTELISEVVSGKVNSRVNVAPPLGMVGFAVIAVLFTFILNYISLQRMLSILI